MKMNKTATKLKPGMTLIEITVVILVLLTLIAVLFIGANIYKKGADRAACILNIRNIQQAVRADQNLSGKTSGVAVATIADPGKTLTSTLFGDGRYFETRPTCPSERTDYGATDDTSYPDNGDLAFTCTQFGATAENHSPDNTEGW